MKTDSSAISRPSVVFLHIPKTAGMTFREILLSCYGAQFHYCDDPTLAGLEAALRGYRCVELHSLTTPTDWHIIHAELVRQNRLDLLEDKEVFTMFRDPVDFYLSSFYYLQTIREIAEPPMKLQGLPFPESLEWLIQHPASFNEQLAFFVGKSQRTGICVDRDDLEMAKEMLIRLKIHAGLTERFEDSVHIFEQVTGETVLGQTIQIINRNGSRPSLSDVPEGIKDQIRQGSALDGELYNFAESIFLAELERCGPAPVYSITDPVKHTEEPSCLASVVSLPEAPAARVLVPKGWSGTLLPFWFSLWNRR